MITAMEIAQRCFHERDSRNNQAARADIMPGLLDALEAEVSRSPGKGNWQELRANAKELIK